MKNIIKFLFVGFLFSGCAGMGKPESLATRWSEVESKSLKANVVWVKKKFAKIDVLIDIENLYPQPISYTDSSFDLKYEGISPFMPNVSPSTLETGEKKRLLVLFEFDHKIPEEGVIRLRLKKVLLRKDKKMAELPPMEFEFPIVSPETKCTNPLAC